MEYRFAGRPEPALVPPLEPARITATAAGHMALTTLNQEQDQITGSDPEPSRIARIAEYLRLAGTQISVAVAHRLVVMRLELPLPAPGAGRVTVIVKPGVQAVVSAAA
jgi:hypothetical protein